MPSNRFLCLVYIVEMLYFILPIFSGKFGFVSNQFCNSFSLLSTSSSLLVVILERMLSRCSCLFFCYCLLARLMARSLPAMRSTSISLSNWAQPIYPKSRRSKLIKPSKLICSIQAYVNMQTHTHTHTHIYPITHNAN